MRAGIRAVAAVVVAGMLGGAGALAFAGAGERRLPPPGGGVAARQTAVMTVWLEPDSGPPGTPVTMSGWGYTAGCKPYTLPPTDPVTPTESFAGPGGGAAAAQRDNGLLILWDGYQIGESTFDEDGYFSYEFDVPANAWTGEHSVYAQCSLGGEYGTSTFTVTPIGNGGSITTDPGTDPPPNPSVTTTIIETRTNTPPPTTSTPPLPTPTLTPTPAPTPTATGTSTPLAAADPPDRSGWTSAVRGPAETDWAPMAVLTSLALAAALVLLVGFPAEIFNKTFEENKDDLRRWFGRLPLQLPDRVPGWVQLLGFVLVAGILTAVVDPNAGVNRPTIALVLGLCVAFVVTTLAYELPGEAYARSVSGLAAVLRVLPPALAVAIGCALLSRLAGFVPGYAYGLFIAFVAARRQLDRGRSGRTVLLSSVVMLGVCLLAWFGWQPVSAAADRPGAGFGLLVVDAVLAGTFVLGVQNIVFGLVPLRFLDGHDLMRWRSAYWMAVYILGAFGFVHVILHPKTAPAGTANSLTVARAAVLFVTFGLASLLFWGFFRIRSAMQEQTS